MSERLILYGYWRSGAAYRVRIGLNLKGLAYESDSINLPTGAQSAPDFLALNPQGLVPALSVGETVLNQSGAILEWLEERYPQPPLLPADTLARAQVRGVAAIVGNDIHPLNNLRVLNQIRGQLSADKEQVQAWIGRWMDDGFTAIEAMLRRYAGAFACGDAPTLADCYLVPQAYSADRFGIGLEPYPTLRRVVETARAHPAVAGAHPDRQPDAPKA